MLSMLRKPAKGDDAKQMERGRFYFEGFGGCSGNDLTMLVLSYHEGPQRSL